LSPEAIEAYLDRVRLVARTDRTITTTQKLGKLLKGVREDGHALLDQELEVGLRSIAVPVRDARGAVVAAMNVSTHASAFAGRDARRSCPCSSRRAQPRHGAAELGI